MNLRAHTPAPMSPYTTHHRAFNPLLHILVSHDSKETTVWQTSQPKEPPKPYANAYQRHMTVKKQALANPTV